MPKVSPCGECLGLLAASQGGYDQQCVAVANWRLKAVELPNVAALNEEVDKTVRLPIGGNQFIAQVGIRFKKLF